MDQQTNYYNYMLDIPYPEVKVHQQDLGYAKLLQEDYAGFISELTAVTQYFYHNRVSYEINKEIADALEGISIIEMHHLKILGGLIVKLGGNPAFLSINNGINQYWNGSYIKYSQDLKQILYDDIKGEQDAIYQYTRHLYFIRDSYIQDIIQRIIQDEKHHIAIFTELLNGLIK